MSVLGRRWLKYNCLFWLISLHKDLIYTTQEVTETTSPLFGGSVFIQIGIDEKKTEEKKGRQYY